MVEEIRNFNKAIKRIKRAVREKERIILYGDEDLDGISSIVVLEETIKNLGGEIDRVCFSNREKNGYGISLLVLDILKERAPALLISLDVGIGNFKEIERANEMGFEVMIIDHHEPLNGLPPASIIIDPKQSDDKYPFKNFANVGIVYKLCLELLGKNASLNLKRSLAELAALGTIADMMPQVEENREIIEEGLGSLPYTLRPGLKALLNMAGLPLEDSLHKIIGALNSGEGDCFEHETYQLLTCPSREFCEELAKRLLERNRQREEGVKNIIKEIERRILQQQNNPFIFEGDKAWKLILMGSAAGSLCQKYCKPVFVFKIGEEESSGSVRTPSDVNSVEVLKFCQHLLINYGGHPRAAGFRVKNENLPKFKECLISYFTKRN